MNEWELADEEIMVATGYHFSDPKHWQHQACVETAHEAQKKLFEWLDKEGYLNMQVDAYYKLCKALGRIDGR